jgi:hypothetical protein
MIYVDAERQGADRALVFPITIIFDVRIENVNAWPTR